MDYPSKEFEGMRFNVNTEQPVLEAFPELLNYEEIAGFVRKENSDKLIRWAFLVYDRKSPYYKDFKSDIMQRKYKVAFALGFPKQDNALMPDMVDIINGKDNAVNELILCCCWMMHSYKYALLEALHGGYLENLKKIRDGDMKLTEEKVVYDQLKKIEQLNDELLAEDRNQYLRETSFRYLETRRIYELAPEHIAKKITAGKSPTI